MPAFAYTGLNASGRTVKGVKSADTVASLKSVLKREGVYLTAVTETNAAVKSAGRSGEAGGAREIDLGAIFDRVQPKQVASMTRLLSTLLIAGVTLPEALRALIDQVPSARFKGVLSDLAAKVNEGSSLAAAMSSHPDVFTKLYINMIRAGESSGSLETVLIRLADFMDQQEELKGKITSAMVYPAAMAVVGILVVGLLMVKVVPQMIEMFADQGAELPWSTRTLIWLTDAITGWWWAQIAFVILVVVAYRRWVSTEAGRLTMDTIFLRMPLIGDLVRKVAIARFARTLSTMLASGVQLLEALDIVKSLLSNMVLEKAVAGARDNIREGEGIAPALKRSGEFPPLVSHMIAVGERSGELESMLGDLAGAYDREVNTSVSRATAILEPLMIVAMAVAVGFIVFAIMQPIIQMNEMAGV